MQYAVIQFGETWRIVCNGYRAGRFTTRAEAVHTAEKLAREARALGSSAELLVQGSDGRLLSRPI